MGLTFDVPPDGGTELAALLERSGVDFQREGERFRFLFTSRGCKWQTVCDCREGLVLVYGIHPAQVTHTEESLALCSRLNRRVVQGSFFLQEGRFVFRTSAELTERWEAQARIARALEYNAAALSTYWERLAAGAQGLTLSFWIQPPGLQPRGFGEPISKRYFQHRKEGRFTPGPQPIQAA